MASPSRLPLDERIAQLQPHRSRPMGAHPVRSPMSNRAVAEPILVFRMKAGPRRPAGLDACRGRAALPWAAVQAARAQPPAARAGLHWQETRAHSRARVARRQHQAATSRQLSHHPSGRGPARRPSPCASSERLWSVRRTHRPAFQEIHARKRHARFLR